MNTEILVFIIILIELTFVTKVHFSKKFELPFNFTEQKKGSQEILVIITWNFAMF